MAIVIRFGVFFTANIKFINFTQSDDVLLFVCC